MQDKKKTVKFSMDMDKIEDMIDKLMESMMEKTPGEKQPLVMGFTINFNSADLPVLEELKEIEESELEKEVVAENFAVPLAEAHYFKNEVIVSFELPKEVLRKNLSVNVTEKTVSVKSKKHAFFKKIPLKQKINPKKFSSSFKNSFLELTFEKK